MKACLLIPCLAMVLPAAAEDKSIDKAQVPKPVIDAAMAKYPKGNLVAFEEANEAGKTSFEIKIELETWKTELILSPDGKILAEEMQISAKELPDAVAKALAASKFAKAKVRKMERVVESDKPEAPTYEIVVEEGSSKHELVFSGAGVLMRVETKGQKKK